MNQIRTIFANMSWLVISQIITSVCAFVWTILTARYLGVYDYGVLGFAVSFTSIFTVIADLGISTHIVRSISTDNSIAPKYLGNALVLKGFLSLAYIAITFVVLTVLGYNELTIFITFLFVIETIIKSFCNLFNGTFQAHEKGKYQAIQNTILNVLTLVFILFAVYIDGGLLGIGIAYILANLFSFIYSTRTLTHNIAVPKLEFDKDFCRMLIVAGIPFALTSLFYTIYYSIDVVMLTQMVGDYASGIYNATYKLINVLTLFYSIYTAVIFPVMSKLYKNEKTLLKTSFEKSIKYLLMVTVPIAIATAFYADEIIHLIYGNQYGDASGVLIVLIWTVCFLFVNGAVTTTLNASHKEVSVTKIYLVAAAFNVILNYFLIPHYSYIGAATATVISEILIFVLAMIALKRIGHVPDIHLFYDVCKIAISSLILAVVLYVANLNMWVAIPVGIIVYLVAIVATQTFDDLDKTIVRQIFRK